MLCYYLYLIHILCHMMALVATMHSGVATLAMGHTGECAPATRGCAHQFSVPVNNLQ